MSKKHEVSDEMVAQALHIAKSTQQPGQTKEQTKLIAKGIEKGIAHFKSQEKAKKRERDKQAKKQKRQIQDAEHTPTSDTENDQTIGTPILIRLFAAIGVLALAAAPIAWVYRDSILSWTC